MNNEQLTIELKHLLDSLDLNDVQELVLIQSFWGYTYSQIASKHGYNPDYLKEVGANLWRLVVSIIYWTNDKNYLIMNLRTTSSK